jgi:hypothetical protein
MAGRGGLAARQLCETAGQSYPGRTEGFSLILEPGGVEQVALRGPAAIRRVAVRLSAVNRDTALRGVVVRGEFDGEQTVEVPLGDFFGTAPGINAYEGLPLGMTRWGEMYSHWHMPFRETVMSWPIMRLRNVIGGERATRRSTLMVRHSPAISGRARKITLVTPGVHRSSFPMRSRATSLRWPWQLWSYQRQSMAHP